MGYLLLAFVAFLGFIASLGCHVMAWLCIDPPFDRTSLMMMLTFGVFVVFLPMGILATKTMPASADVKDGNKHIFAELPKWLEKTYPYLIVYFIFNFFYGIYSTGQFPKSSIPFYLSLRIASGHWMLFYGVSVLGFVGLFRLSRKKRAVESDATPPGQ
jgi:hypothetical protein